MNYKSILYFLGIYSLFISFFSILNIFYSIYFDHTLDLYSYFITFIISLLVGSFFCYLGYKHIQNITLSDQIMFIVISFVYVPLLISIPYFLSSYNINFLDSYFESVSGITSTGFSIIEDISYIDEPLLLWRSSSQWLGGLLLLIAIVGTIGSRQSKIRPVFLVSSEASGKNFYNNFNIYFIKILLIYFLSTLAIIVLFKISNIRLFDSVNLAFTAISSGGFISTENLSDILTNNFKIFIFSISLLFPIFNFYLFFNIFTRKFKFQNHHEDLHLALIIIITTLIFYFIIIPNRDFVNILLSIVTSISTSGLVVNNLNIDSTLFFILLTIMGGSLIATSSGIKYTRFYILLKISYQEIYRLVKPINIFNKNLYNVESKIDDDDSKIAFMVFISFIILVFVLTSFLTLDNLSFEDSFKLSILTLTNTVTSSLYGLESLNFFDLNNFTKIFLIVFMILGKIEIIAILFLIKKFIFKE